MLQHANEDVEKMILGNKCDMEDKRQVSRERGDAVSAYLLFFVHLLFFAMPLVLVCYSLFICYSLLVCYTDRLCMKVSVWMKCKCNVNVKHNY